MNNSSRQGSNINQTQRRHDFDRHYTAVYGDPWYGGAGWNSGWYGNGYGNNGYYNDPTYTNGFSDQSNGQSTSSTLTPAPTPPPSTDNQTPTSSEAWMENTVDKSPKMAAANSAVQSAQAAYDAERERVLASLATKPEYKDALARQHQASSDVNAVKSTPASPSSMPSVVAAAETKLNASDEVTKMQEEAIAADPEAATAKSHLAEAVAARDGMRAEMLSKR